MEGSCFCSNANSKRESVRVRIQVLAPLGSQTKHQSFSSTSWLQSFFDATYVPKRLAHEEGSSKAPDVPDVSRLKSYSQHKKTHSKPFHCETCQRGFALRLDLDRHVKARHRVGTKQYRCDIGRCYFKTPRKDNLSRHLRKSHADFHQGKGKNGFLEWDKKAQSTLLATPPLLTSLKSGQPHDRLVIMQAAAVGDITMLEALFSQGFELETKADDLSTVLHCAARTSQTAAVQHLLEKGANITTKNDKGRTPLYEAILGRNADTTKLLLSGTVKREIDCITEREGSRRYQRRADSIFNELEDYIAQSGSLQIVQLYIENFGRSFATRVSHNLLAAAVEYGQTLMVASLLRIPGIEINKSNHGGNAPIHQAARYGHVEIMKLLLACEKIDLNVKTRLRSFTALHVAALKGHLDIIETLLRQEGIEIISLSYEQNTPLHSASLQGHTKIVKYFLSQEGVDINCKNFWGETPLHLSTRRRQSETVELLLNQRGVDSSCQDKFKKTPLHVSAEEGHLNLVRLLLNQGHADACCRDKREQTPLQRAAFNGHWEAVHILLEHRESPDHCFDYANEAPQEPIDRLEVIGKLLRHPDFQDVNLHNGWYVDLTLLHNACIKGDCEIIRCLLACKDIDVNNTAYHGQSPLIVAADKNQMDAVRLLLEHKDTDIDFRCPHNAYWNGWNALEFAKRNQNQDMVDLLLSHGAKDFGSGLPTTVAGNSNVAGVLGDTNMLSNPRPEAASEVRPYAILDGFLNDDPPDYSRWAEEDESLMLE